MPEFTSPKLEEFYNHAHDPATGRFSGRAASGKATTNVARMGAGRNVTIRQGHANRYGGGPGAGELNKLQTQKGGASIARATLPKSLGFRHAAKNSSSTLKPTTGFVQHKDALKNAQAKAAAANTKMAADNANRAKFSGLKSGGNVSKTRVYPPVHPSGRSVIHTKGVGGHPATGTKLPVHNATTGRINPSPARAAFKQGTSEIIGKKQDSKRTTLTGPKVVPNGYGGGGSHKVSQTVKTVKTYKGRVISHVSSKGGADRAGFREGG